MHVHVPKALHGLREVMGEIGIIVIGVVIAIALEQAVEQLHWAREVKVARAAIHSEMARADRHFAYRVAAQACVTRRLDALETVIERVARHEPVPRLGEVMPDIGNAFGDNIWQNHRAAQTLTHFEDKEVDTLGVFYMQIGSVRQLVNQEGEALTVLSMLQGDPGRLGPADVANLRMALQRVRFDNGLIASIAQDELDWAKSLHLPAPAPDAQRLKDICAPLPVVGAP